MRIYYYAPDDQTPSGGIKQLYRHVDILNSQGIEARILHRKKDFRVSWFNNNTPITYIGEPLAEHCRRFFHFKPFLHSLTIGSLFFERNLRGAWNKIPFNDTDVLVLPEYLGKELVNLAPEVRKVIFNQNAHYTFHGYSCNNDKLVTVYENPRLLGIMVVSEFNKKYLEYAFPHLPIYRVKNGIDSHVFSYSSTKKKQIAFMPRKLREEAVQVINLLKCRGIIGDWKFVPIVDMAEKEVAHVMNEAALFLSFSSQEGLSLPPMEAASSGCLIIGYTGTAAEEYFLPNYSYPIPQSDVLLFAQTVESILKNYDKEALLFTKKAHALSQFVQNEYSLEKEKHSVIEAWKSLLEKAY